MSEPVGDSPESATVLADLTTADVDGATPVNRVVDEVNIRQADKPDTAVATPAEPVSEPAHAAPAEPNEPYVTTAGTTLAVDLDKGVVTAVDSDGSHRVVETDHPNELHQLVTAVAHLLGR